MVIFHSYVKLPGGNDSVLRYREWLEDVFSRLVIWLNIPGTTYASNHTTNTPKPQRQLTSPEPSSPKSFLVSTYIHRVSFLPKNRNNKKQPWPILGILIILPNNNPQPLSLFPYSIYSGFSSLLLWGLCGAPRAVPDTKCTHSSFSTHEVRVCHGHDS